MVLNCDIFWTFYHSSFKNVQIQITAKHQQRVGSTITSIVLWMRYHWDVLYAFNIVANDIWSVYWAQAHLLLSGRSKLSIFSEWIYTLTNYASNSIFLIITLCFYFSLHRWLFCSFLMKYTMYWIISEPHQIYVVHIK